MATIRHKKSPQHHWHSTGFHATQGLVASIPKQAPKRESAWALLAGGSYKHSAVKWGLSQPRAATYFPRRAFLAAEHRPSGRPPRSWWRKVWLTPGPACATEGLR